MAFNQWNKSRNESLKFVNTPSGDVAVRIIDDSTGGSSGVTNKPKLMSGLGTGNNDDTITVTAGDVVKKITFEGSSLLGNVTVQFFDGTAGVGTALTEAVYLKAVLNGLNINKVISGTTLGVRLAGRTGGGTTLAMNIELV